MCARVCVVVTPTQQQTDCASKTCRRERKRDIGSMKWWLKWHKVSYLFPLTSVMVLQPVHDKKKRKNNQIYMSFVCFLSPVQHDYVYRDWRASSSTPYLPPCSECSSSDTIRESSMHRKEYVHNAIQYDDILALFFFLIGNNTTVCVCACTGDWGFHQNCLFQSLWSRHCGRMGENHFLNRRLYFRHWRHDRRVWRRLCRQQIWQVNALYRIWYRLGRRPRYIVLSSTMSLIISLGRCVCVCVCCDQTFRKRGLLLNNATGILGAALMAFSKAAQSYEMLIIGRLIIGFNCGTFSS